MIGNIVDRVVSVFSPARGLARVQARASMDRIAAFTNGGSGYNAGKYNRLTKTFARNQMNENQVPAGQIDQLRAESWNLYRNNPYAKKIVRTLETKVIGRGLSPQSLATRADGSPHVEFRDAVAKLWKRISNRLDIRGTPGRGGQSICDLQKLALRSVILSGDVLCRPWAVKVKDSPVSISLQMIAGERLSILGEKKVAEGNVFYRGVELTSDGRRAAYHISRPVLENYVATTDTIDRIPAEKIVHLYVSEDVDQLRGVPWFAPTLLNFRDTGDLQYNVLKASAIASCFVAGYRLATGQSKLGLEGDGEDLSDADGNRITKVQPGMLINLGEDGDLKGVSPNQPTTNAEAFIKHMLRGCGAALPGVKPTTVTGDYKGASFSSERSADNDCWPEMEGVQDWFGDSFCQPIFEAIIDAAILDGWFKGIVDAVEYEARRDEFLAAAWQGPVARSINPKDDAESAALRVKSGLSSPQIEAANVGEDWRKILTDVAEFKEVAEAVGLGEDYVNGVLSIKAVPEPAGSEKPAAKADPEEPAADDEAGDE